MGFAHSQFPPLPAPGTFVLNKAHQEETLDSLSRNLGRELAGGHVVLQEKRQVPEKDAQGKRTGECSTRTPPRRVIAKLYLVHTYLLALSEKTLRIAGEAQGLCTAGEVSVFYCATIFFTPLNLQGLQQEEKIHQVFTRKGRGGNFWGCPFKTCNFLCL